MYEHIIEEHTFRFTLVNTVARLHLCSFPIKLKKKKKSAKTCIFPLIKKLEIYIHKYVYAALTCHLWLLRKSCMVSDPGEQEVHHCGLEICLRIFKILCHIMNCVLWTVKRTGSVTTQHTWKNGVLIVTPRKFHYAVVTKTSAVISETYVFIQSQ